MKKHRIFTIFAAVVLTLTLIPVGIGLAGTATGPHGKVWTSDQKYYVMNNPYRATPQTEMMCWLDDKDHWGGSADFHGTSGGVGVAQITYGTTPFDPVNCPDTVGSGFPLMVDDPRSVYVSWTFADGTITSDEWNYYIEIWGSTDGTTHDWSKVNMDLMLMFKYNRNIGGQYSHDYVDNTGGVWEVRISELADGGVRMPFPIYWRRTQTNSVANLRVSDFWKDAAARGWIRGSNYVLGINAGLEAFNKTASYSTSHWNVVEVLEVPSVPGRIEAERFTSQSGTIRYADGNSSNGQYMGDFNGSDWAEYTVNVPTGGTYTIDFRVASLNTNTQLQLKEGATVLATVNVGNTGGWTSWKTESVQVSLSAGQKTWRLQNSGSGNYPNIDYFEVKSSQAPTPTPTPPPPSGNLALNRPVTASSTESSAYPASAAVDGNTGTRWSSAFSDPQWIYVDLGAIYSISRVVLRWETAYGKAYQIQVSNDASTWATIYSTTTGDGGLDDLPVTGSGRYVRMYGTARGTPWGYSLWEFEVYGSGGSGLPSPWQTQDIGAVAATGSASYSDGVFTVNGSGADIWGTADEFRFVYQTLNGDGQIVARVTGVQNTNAWAKAGVMMRETLDANSKHAMMALTPGNGLAFQRRTGTGGESSHTSGGSASAPYWVKLVRSGNTFTAYKSSDGTNWTQVGSETISMGTSVYVGLAVTSHADGTLCTATFDNVSVGGGGGPTNLLTNPGFESGTSGWTCNNCSLSTVSSPVQSGSNAASVTNRGAEWAGAMQDVKSVLESNGQGNYTIEAWVRMHSGSATAKVTLKVQANSTSYFHATCSANSSSWTKCSATHNVTWSGALQEAKFYVETTSGTTSYYADDCVLRR